MCLKSELGWRRESEREAITLGVVLIKKFFTLPFTIKNMNFMFMVPCILIILYR